MHTSDEFELVTKEYEDDDLNCHPSMIYTSESLRQEKEIAIQTEEVELLTKEYEDDDLNHHPSTESLTRGKEIMQTSEAIELVTKEYEDDDLNHHPSTSRDDQNLNSLNEEGIAEHVSVDVEYEEYQTALEHMIEMEAAFRFRDAVPCSTPSVVKIDKVPEKLHYLNKDAYSPRVVSVGLLHYDRLHSNFLRYKNKCLHRYLSCSDISVWTINSMAVKHKKSIKSGYSSSSASIISSKKDFVEMITMDSIFMIELFLEDHLGNPFPIFDNTWRNRDILHDMILFENQIPCTLLKDLFEKRHSFPMPLFKWIHRYFQNVGNMDNLPPIDYPFTHLLDFLRKCHCPTDDVSLVNDRIGWILRTHSAKELQAGGIQLRKETAESKQLSDITLSAEDGILTMPQLIVNEWSETFYLNLIAFEQTNLHETQYISSYFILIENLTKTTEDVDLLVRCGIIKNLLGDNEQVRSLFVNLRKNIPMDGPKFYFASLCEGLNTYTKDRRHQWKGAWYNWKQMLRRDYFSSPWSIISVIAAFMLLSLTVIQTVCSVISVR